MPGSYCALVARFNGARASTRSRACRRFSVDTATETIATLRGPPIPARNVTLRPHDRGTRALHACASYGGQQIGVGVWVVFQCFRGLHEPAHATVVTARRPVFGSGRLIFTPSLKAPQGLLSDQVADDPNPHRQCRSWVEAVRKRSGANKAQNCFLDFNFFRSRPQRYSSSDCRNQEGFSTCRLNACVFTRPPPTAADFRTTKDGPRPTLFRHSPHCMKIEILTPPHLPNPPVGA